MLSVARIRERFAGGGGGAAVAESDVPQTALTPAAVLIPIVRRASGMTVLLTQRTAHLRDHAGQVSFPGGRCEPHDANRVDTALREAHEEVGIEPAQVEVLGCLPEYLTSTGFRVTPVVGFVNPPLNLRLDDFEVADVFEPPLEFLLDAANHQRHKLEYGGALREYWAMPWKGYYIWGATAGMLVSLYRFLCAECA
ncbi:MAG: CoA pyrophosphatase [Rhodocyclaceae bacterium]|nr:CoA pyrophosphatase [Rhodocyclaceae bacterium]